MCRSWSAAWSSIGTRLSLPREAERAGRGDARFLALNQSYLKSSRSRRAPPRLGSLRDRSAAAASPWIGHVPSLQAIKGAAPPTGSCAGRLRSKWTIEGVPGLVLAHHGNLTRLRSRRSSPCRWCRHPRSRRRQPQGPAGRARVTWSIACSLPRWIEGAADLESSLAVSVMEQPRTSLAPTLLVAYQLAYWRQTTLQVLGARRPVGPARSLAGRKSYKHRTRRKP